MGNNIPFEYAHVKISSNTRISYSVDSTFHVLFLGPSVKKRVPVIFPEMLKLIRAANKIQQSNSSSISWSFNGDISYEIVDIGESQEVCHLCGEEKRGNFIVIKSNCVYYGRRQSVYIHSDCKHKLSIVKKYILDNYSSSLLKEGLKNI